MKYLALIKRYLYVFVGAVLFGLAAVKLKSARRSENKANDKLRDLQESEIEEYDEKIDHHVTKLKDAEARANKRKEDAIRKLDKISENSSSVSDLLDEYNSRRV